MRRFLAALVAFMPLVAAGQVGEWGSRGVSRHFVVRGDRVFDADGRGVAVYDISQSPIRRIAVAETSSESLDLAFLNTGDLAVATRDGIDRYAVAPNGALTATAIYPDAVRSVLASNGHYLAGVTAIGVTIWDGDTLDVVSRFSLSQPISALAWHDDTLIAAVPGVGLYFLDATGARDPIIAAENARDIAVNGDRLYVAASVNGIVIYDLTTAPTLISRSEAGLPDFARIAVGGTRLFVAELPDKIHVFDIDSGFPVFSTQITEPVQTIAATPTRLLVSGTIFDPIGLTTETGAPLRVFDVTGATPQLKSEFRDFAGPVSGVATDGSLAYIVDRPYFRIIDISTTAAPREISSLQIDAIGDRVKVRGNQAIIFGRGDVQLIDVSNPYAPRPVKVFHSEGHPPSNADFARNTILEGNAYSGFHVVDFVNFADPGQIGGIKGHYFDVIANGGDVAWVSLQGSALMTIDLSDPHNPVSIQGPVIGGVRGEFVAATDRHPELLVMQTLSGIRIYDLSNELNPVQLSFMPTPVAMEAAADADIAYFALPGLLQTIDLSDAPHTAFSMTSMRPISPMQLGASKGKLVIADRYSLRIYGPNTPPPPPPPAVRRRVVVAECADRLSLGRPTEAAPHTEFASRFLICYSH